VLSEKSLPKMGSHHAILLRGLATSWETITAIAMISGTDQLREYI
jgi:hypothetical protein